MLWAYSDIIYLHDHEGSNLVAINFEEEKFLFNSKEVRTPLSKDLVLQGSSFVVSSLGVERLGSESPIISRDRR